MTDGAFGAARFTFCSLAGGILDRAGLWRDQFGDSAFVNQRLLRGSEDACIDAVAAE